MALLDVLTRNRLDQSMVADAIGVSRMTLYNWVHGRSLPAGRYIQPLLEYLRRYDPSVTLGDILPPTPLPPDPAAARQDAEEEDIAARVAAHRAKEGE